MKEEIKSLETMMRLWIASIDCSGLDCKQCKLREYCNMVSDIMLKIEENKRNEEL